MTGGAPLQRGWGRGGQEAQVHQHGPGGQAPGQVRVQCQARGGGAGVHWGLRSPDNHEGRERTFLKMGFDREVKHKQERCKVSFIHS